jgi:perosamine synthetase
MILNNTDTQSFVEGVCKALKEVCGDGDIQLHAPIFNGRELQYLKGCLDTTFVSSVGEYVNQFEREITRYTDTKYAVALVNGTSALHLALLLAEVNSRDEVLIPSLTFIATANAVSYCGASPHFIDIEEDTLGISSVALRDWLEYTAELRNGQCFNKRTQKRIRAIIPMHVFGHPADMEGILSVAFDYKLKVIEDAAEAFGSKYHGRYTGSFGDMGVLSFNGNKIITTGGGGAIVTSNSELAKRAKHMSTTAKKPHPWKFEHTEVAYNYRLPNINAALGCAQLEQLPAFIRSKRELFRLYQKHFNKLEGLSIKAEPKNCESNYWLQTLILAPQNTSYRDEIIEKTNEIGLMTRPVWSLLHRHPFYEGFPKSNLSVSEKVESQLISIPSSANIL